MCSNRHQHNSQHSLSSTSNHPSCWRVEWIHLIFNFDFKHSSPILNDQPCFRVYWLNFGFLSCKPNSQLLVSSTLDLSFNSTW